MFKVLLLVSFYVVCSHSYFIEVNETLRNLLSQFQTFRDDLSARRNGVDFLKRQTNSLKEVLPQKEERSVYLGNLSNSFLLIKRLSKVWPKLLSLTKSLSGNAMKPVRLILNNTDLWRSALTGLVRLQETYNIPTETIADGQIEAAYRNTHLTAEDCFDIGVFYFRLLRHSSRAIEWFKSALMRAKEGTFSSALIMKYLYFSQCFIGDSKSASLTLTTILENDPSFFLSAEFREEYAYIANSSCTEIAKKFNKSLYEKFEDVHNVKFQRGLCRMKNQASIDSRLKCRLMDYHQSHLRIRPFKMEELHLDPPLLRFYEVIYDKEIEALKNIHYSNSKPAILDYNMEAEEYHDTQYNVWLHTNYDVDDLLGKINRRSKEITNLDLYRAEPLMLASYGIAGEIKLHDDLGPKVDMLNSIYSTADYATLIFYLNNVPDGGLTIFPLLNVSVVPSKGDAIFFLNRHPDWERNVEMLHSGCPILRGDKWIMTKWFHVIGQDFPKCVPGKEKTFRHYYL